MDYKALRPRFPAVLVIGSEKRRMSTQLLEAATFIVRIPMYGDCDSINAAVASGVLLAIGMTRHDIMEADDFSSIFSTVSTKQRDDLCHRSKTTRHVQETRNYSPASNRPVLCQASRGRSSSDVRRNVSSL